MDLRVQRPPLKRSLGLWMATALVIGNMIGSGVFLLPSALAAEAGPLSLVGWVVTGAGAMLLALVFANLGRAYPETGGPYAYTRRAFGDFIGFQTAWGYWIAVWAGNAAIAVAFVGYLSVFWTGLAASPLASATVAAALIWLLTAINVVGVRQSGIVQLITTILKFVPLLVIAIIGLFFMNADHFTPFVPEGVGVFGGITAAATLTLWAFIGLESSTVPAGEVIDPERTIPRSTLLGTGVTTLVYILATVAIMGILPISALVGSTSPFADAANEIFGGTWGGKGIALIAMASTFGALNGWILLQGRVPLAAADDGLFPRSFGKVHGVRRTPVFGLVASSILVTGLMFMNYNAGLVDRFSQFLLLATLTTLVPYAFSAAAQVQLWITDRERFSGRSFAKDTIIASLAFAYALWTIWGSGAEVVFNGFALLMAGIPIYVWMKYREINHPVVTVPHDLSAMPTTPAATDPHTV